MATDRIAQSKHNKRIRDLIRSRTPSYLDWEITAIFYAALHLIDMHLQALGKTVRNHRQRIVAVKRNLPDVYDPYAELYSLSIKARYEGIDFVDTKSTENARRAYDQLQIWSRRALRS